MCSRAVDDVARPPDRFETLEQLSSPRCDSCIVTRLLTIEIRRIGPRGVAPLHGTNANLRVGPNTGLGSASAQQAAINDADIFTFVARSSIDLNLAFTFTAQEAGLIGPIHTFNAFGSDLNFLLAAFSFDGTPIGFFSNGVNGTIH